MAEERVIKTACNLCVPRCGINVYRSADVGNAKAIILWGHNPDASDPTMARTIRRAKEEGAKLFVIDPRRPSLLTSFFPQPLSLRKPTSRHMGGSILILT